MAARSTKINKEVAEPSERAPAVPLSAAELQTRISARAYEVFLARNGATGDELSDWLTAEREVCALLLTIAPSPVDEIPLSTSTPKPNRSTAKPAVAGSSTKTTTRSSRKASVKPAEQSSSTVTRSRKRKTASE